jgi:IS5 family transposase
MLYNRVLSQQKQDRKKIYNLHEPEVECISKGKEYKKYEFGNKVSLLYTQHTGVIVRVLSLRNPYGGHPLPNEQVEGLVIFLVRKVFPSLGHFSSSGNFNRL